MAERLDTSERRSRFVINLISIAVPAVIVVLLAFPNKLELGPWTSNLPHAIGLINSLTSVILVIGLISIRRNNVKFHRAMMVSAFALGIGFLVCYVTYHVSNPSNKFSGVGFVRYLYLFVLLTHVLLSLVVLPLVLRAMFYAITDQIGRHKNIAKYAYPIWLYVSVSGVFVYIMLNHLF